MHRLMGMVAAAIASAAPATAQVAAPAVSNAPPPTVDGRDAIDLDTVPPALDGTRLSGSAATDAGLGSAGTADTTSSPPPRRGVELNARVGKPRRRPPPPR